MTRYFLRTSHKKYLPLCCLCVALDILSWLSFYYPRSKGQREISWTKNFFKLRLMDANCKLDTNATNCTVLYRRKRVEVSLTHFLCVFVGNKNPNPMKLHIHIGNKIISTCSVYLSSLQEMVIGSKNAREFEQRISGCFYYKIIKTCTTHVRLMLLILCYIMWSLK